MQSYMELIWPLISWMKENLSLLKKENQLDTIALNKSHMEITPHPHAKSQPTLMYAETELWDHPRPVTLKTLAQMIANECCLDGSPFLYSQTSQQLIIVETISSQGLRLVRTETMRLETDAISVLLRKDGIVNGMKNWESVCVVWQKRSCQMMYPLSQQR